ncbi:MAG: hypothetical protein ACE5E0_05245 [Terriglobia bacterium]
MKSPGWAIGGFSVTFLIALFLLAYGKPAVDWSFTAEPGSLSFSVGVLSPAIVTGLVGLAVGGWLGRAWAHGHTGTVSGVIAGSIFFLFLNAGSLLPEGLLKSMIVSFAYLPGAFLADTIVYPALSSMTGPQTVVMDSKEPVLAWANVTLSWFLWGLIGAMLGSALRPRRIAD